MKASNSWLFLCDAEMRRLAHDMSANSLANSTLLTSENMATPLGIVFDFWNNDDLQRAKELLASLLYKREAGLFNEAFLRLEATLFGVYNVDGTRVYRFALWLNQNGLKVQLLVAGNH